MFRVGAWLKLWKLEDRNGRLTAQASTSRKDKQTGEYETDFSGFVSFGGGCVEKAKSLSEGDRIKILECAVGTRYVKEKNKEYVNYYIFDFETQDNDSGANSAPAEERTSSALVDGENCPF